MLTPVPFRSATGARALRAEPHLDASSVALARMAASERWRAAQILCYHSSIMKRRAGGTEKISISLSRSDLAALTKRAKRLYGGNVSAVISELAADAALLEGMHELVSWLGGPSLTDRDRAAIDREWSEQPPAPKRTRNGKKAA